MSYLRAALSDLLAAAEHTEAMDGKSTAALCAAIGPARAALAASATDEGPEDPNWRPGFRYVPDMDDEIAALPASATDEGPPQWSLTCCAGAVTHAPDCPTGINANPYAALPGWDIELPESARPAVPETLDVEHECAKSDRLVRAMQSDWRFDLPWNGGRRPTSPEAEAALAALDAALSETP